MKEFSGFLEDTNRLTPIPTQFFSELLALIDHLGELKVTLFALGFIGKSGDYANCLRVEDFTSEATFMASMGNNPQEALNYLNDGLERAVQRGSLIKVPSPLTPAQVYYFINTPRGRSAAQVVNKGVLPAAHSSPANIQEEKANIFNLYEANIGPLTPMIAETLREAEKTYPLIWIGDAMKIAVQNNVRRWHYVEAILKSWKEEGRDGGDQQHAKEDYRRYVKGKFGQFGKR